MSDDIHKRLRDAGRYVAPRHDPVKHAEEWRAVQEQVRRDAMYQWITLGLLAVLSLLLLIMNHE